MREGLKESQQVALHYGIQKLFAKNSFYTAAAKRVPIASFGYDFEDYRGQQDYTKMFVSKALATGKGQCHSLPLVYLVETPTTVRIVDKTNSSEMLLLPVQGKTTISLTESGGLRVGGTPMRFANLPGDHEYEIYLQNSVANPNVFRTGTVRPGQAPASPAPGAVTPPSDVPSQPLLPNTGTVTGGTP